MNCDTGAIQLVNARVRGDVWLDNTKIENKDGPVFNAEGIRVAGSLLVCSGFEAKATSRELATVHLMSARIGSRLDLGNGREFTGMSYGPADPVRTPAVIENGHESKLVLDLRCVTVNELRLLPETICEPTDSGCSKHNKVVLGGLKYSTLSLESTHSHWPHWFSRHAEPFEAEPYQHLASIMRDTGQATEAKEILIELENERYRRNEAKTIRSQVWHWVKRAFIGHGYKPGRALVGLLCVVGFAMIVTTLANQFGWISRPALLVQGIDPGEAVRLRCSPGDAIRLAADLSVPLINTSGRLRCDFGHEGIAANIGTILGIILQVLGWAFATLFVAGFSGVVRKI